MSNIKTHTSPALSPTRIEGTKPTPSAVSTTQIPETQQAQTLKQGDQANTVSIAQQNMSAAEFAVKGKMEPVSTLRASDVNRLLKSPAQRLQLGRVLRQQPELAQAFLKHPGGATALNLLKKPNLSNSQVKTIQSFLAKHSGESLAYKGHATGVDGQYGKKTHNALLKLLTREIKASPNETPSSQPTSYKGHGAALNNLSAQEQQQFKTSHPDIHNLLSKPALTTSQTRQLQQALVDAGQDLSYKGNATGVDGDFGKRSKAALSKLIEQSKKTSAPAQPAEPVDTKPVDTTPPKTTAPEPVKLNLNAKEPLQQLAQKINQLPADTLSKLPENLQQALKTAGETAELPKQAAKDLQQALVDAGQKLNYPGHVTGVDGKPGQRTREALINVVNSVVSGDAAVVSKSGPFPQYNSMLDDGLLDMTMAIGYDEGSDKYASANLSQERKMLRQLSDRGFVRDDAKAMALLKEAGHELDADYTAFYVKENVTEKNGEPVHALVRVIHAGDGSQGASKRAAVIESMNQSDVFMYGGHARYGTGMDFDRNFTVTINWEGVKNAPGKGEVTYKDYGALKELLGGNEKANQWLKTLESEGKITVEGSNDGNVRMSEKDLHPAEFGSRLMDRALDGVENTLSEEIQGDRHRLWLFNGCRTSDYMPSIHAEGKTNPALQGEKLDVVTTEQTLYWSNISNSLMSFLDGVTAADGTPDMMGRLQDANPQQADKATHSIHGFKDNPRR